MSVELGAMFRSFQRYAFRLETLDRYTVPEETETFAAFLRGEPLPADLYQRPWLKMVTDHTTAGRRMQRVHLVTPPLSDYLRYEFTVQQETNIGAGEDIRITQRTTTLAACTQDFWLFDDTAVFTMRYGGDGMFLGVDHADDPQVVTECCRQRDLALAAAIPLPDYVAGSRL